MLSSLWFLIQEAWLNLRRQGLMALASISTTTISLLILGAFLVLALQAYAVLKGAPEQFEIHAFMRLDVTREQADLLLQDLRGREGVATVELVTREEAWEKYRQESAYRDLLDGFTENPLPHMLRIVATRPEETLRVAESLRRVPEVEQVNEGRDVLRKLLSLFNAARVVGLVLAGLLALGTAAIISNAIRMTLYARRRDIRVMQLVGATNSFIRLPFLIEGMVEGVVGGLAAGSVLLIAVHYYMTRLVQSLPLVNQFHLSLDTGLLFAAVVAAGALLGAMGSLLSLRKFLHAA